MNTAWISLQVLLSQGALENTKQTPWPGPRLCCCPLTPVSPPRQVTYSPVRMCSMLKGFQSILQMTPPSTVVLTGENEFPSLVHEDSETRLRDLPQARVKCPSARTNKAHCPAVPLLGICLQESQHRDICIFNVWKQPRCLW